MGRNFFHGDVRNQCVSETVFNVDTRKSHTTLQLYLLQRWAPKQKQRIPEIVFDVDTQQNHTTLQLYLFQRWARKMYVVPGVLWVHTSSDELLILSACHWAGLVGDQPPQRGPPCHRGGQTSHLIYTFAGREGEGHTTKHQRAGGLEELTTIVLCTSLD